MGADSGGRYSYTSGGAEQVSVPESQLNQVPKSM